MTIRELQLDLLDYDRGGLLQVKGREVDKDKSDPSG